jgi:D-alanyl-D-alanine carboxypeptidase
MKKVIVMIILLGLFGCSKPDIDTSNRCTFAIPASISNHPKHAAFTSIMEKYRIKGLPGIAILIEDEDGIWLGVSGKADIEHDIEFQLCNPSKAASITKLMVATLTFMLQEEGKLDIHDPISEYIDNSIISKVKNADKVSIKNCLQHTTGIYDIITDSKFYLEVLNNPNKSWEAEDLIRFAYGKEPYFEANDSARYSNTNTLLVSMVLNKVLGYNHAKALRERIWAPLGMSDTYYQSREKLPNTTAQGYYDLYNDGTIANVSNLITGSGNGYGGVFSTVFDLYKFMRALYYDKTLISTQSLTAMQEFRYCHEKLETGVGMQRRFKNIDPDHPGIGHAGRDLGYSADMFLFPTRNDRLMIFFVNYGTDGDTELRQVFYDFERDLILKLLE